MLDSGLNAALLERVEYGIEWERGRIGIRFILGLMDGVTGFFMQQMVEIELFKSSCK